jgi:hypothetical protein
MNGQTLIFGQFEGPTFRGQLNVLGRLGALSCTYMPRLERGGS